ncbi:MAG: HTTM domain-containing protein, partial [Pirellulaceae bacterium]|nr:HTTM domain-containing protein [Pirellulaceae bacterium]
GAMLLYGHLVLASELSSFLGDDAWINNDTARQMHDGAYGIVDWGRSYLWYFSNPLLVWGHHALTILVTFAFMIGLMTRITGPAAWFLQLMYIHRLTGALFGLDQIMTYSVMYLMLAPCGSVYSVDAWLRKKFSLERESDRRLRWLLPDARPTVSANIATRLFQLHLCVIYLFGGLAKARGESWWDGSAVWYAIANYEYQSLDMTWLASYPRTIAALSNTTLFWEVFYCALIWPRLTRPIVLAIAIGVHGGIALFLGMATFGLMMLAANLIFVEPHWLRSLHPFATTDDHSQADDDLGLDFDRPSPQAIAAASQPQGAYYGITDADVVERAKKVDAAAEQLREEHAKLKARERKYKSRVKRLKKREAKIKAYVARRRKAKEDRAAQRAKDGGTPQ